MKIKLTAVHKKLLPLGLDATTIAQILLGQLNTWIPILFSTVKTTASKVKLKKLAGPLKIAGAQLIHIGEEIDAA